MSEKKITIDFCVPVYNEEKILKQNILQLFDFLKKQNFDFSWQIVIVVNGSNDQSLQIAEKLNKKHNKIKYINFQKGGRGQALRRYWQKSKADIVLYMDVDLAVSLHNIPDLIKPIINKKANLTIGSRLLADSKIKRSFIRELSSQGYNFLSRLILKHHFSDMQCGFKAIEKNVFMQIEPCLKENYWFFDTELIAFAKKFNFKIKEIPVDWSENRYDKRKSKVNLISDSFKFLVNLIKLRKRLNEANNHNSGL